MYLLCLLYIECDVIMLCVQHYVNMYNTHITGQSMTTYSGAHNSIQSYQVLQIPRLDTIMGATVSITTQLTRLRARRMMCLKNKLGQTGLVLCWAFGLQQTL